MTDTRRTGRLNDFDSIADIYDQLVDWAPYERWVSDLEPRLRRCGLKRRAWILDAACGTGLSTLPWLDRGYHVVGVDASAPMLRMASKRFREAGFNVMLINEDMLSMQPGRTFDMVLCMHSGLDYLLDDEDLARAFVSFRRCLEPGGLLAFDKCLDEPGFYRKDYGNTRTLTVGEAAFDYHWDRPRGMLVQHCVVTRTDRTPPTRHEFVYHLKATRPRVLVDMVERAGFRMLEPLDQFCVEDPGTGIFKAV